MVTFLKSLRSNEMVTGSTILAGGQLLFNLIGYVTTILMGRVLTEVDFGTLALFSSFFFVIGIPAGALGLTVQHFIAWLSGRSIMAYTQAKQKTITATLLFGSVFTFLYLLAAPYLQNFFQLETVSILYLFAPALLGSFFLFWFKSYIKGHLDFNAAALLIVFEGLIKLMGIVLVLQIGLGLAGVIVVYSISIILANLISWLYISFKKYPLKNSSKKSISKITWKDLLNFYFPVVISQLGLMTLLSVDMLYLKHLVSPEVAGQYALLTVFGKIIILGTTSIISAITPFIAQQQDTNKSQKTILTGSAIILMAISLIVTAVTIFGNVIASTVLGEKGLLIAPLLPQYSLAVGSISLGLFIIESNLQQKRFSFSAISIIYALILGVGLASVSGSIDGVVTSYMFVGLSYALTSFVWYAILQTKSWYTQVQDFLSNLDENKKTILIFNWRDSRHVWSGGAEVYVHELGKRFVKKDYQVILFCGNDQHSPRTEETNGIKIIRHGGFNTVYLWAAIYYLLFLGKKSDFVIDCENGIPFFTPLFSKLPKVLVIHHIHQEVFQNHLPYWKAKIAQFLEGRLMPWLYQKETVVTVSESSQTALIEAGIARAECSLVHSGVDLGQYKTGEKTSYPSILYVGRLKAYKSIDVLIKAIDIIKDDINHVQLLIAGDGEEAKNLKKLVKKLGLTPYVTFKGRVSEKEKIDLYKKAWVVVNPSFMEGFGITSIEANASGSVMIASDVPGLRDSVKDGYSGILIPYGNVSALAEAATHLIENSNLRQRMEEYALSWSKRYSWDLSTQKFINIIEHKLTTHNSSLNRHENNVFNIETYALANSEGSSLS